MNTTPYYARIIRDDTGERKQLLTDHLRQTARMTEWLLAPLGLGKIGYLAGILHDTGKTRPGFVALLARTHTIATDKPKTSQALSTRKHHSGMRGRWAVSFSWGKNYRTPFATEYLQQHTYSLAQIDIRPRHLRAPQGVYTISPSEDALSTEPSRALLEDTR